MMCKAVFKLNLFCGAFLLGIGLFFAGCKKDQVESPLPPQPNPKVFELPPTSRVVMYEVNLRAFSQDGSFAGLEARLPDLERLQVNVIWLMPIHPVGQVRSAGGLGSPYSVRDYRGIAQEYGNLADFKRLVQAAHQKGMAVILDWVANHTAWDHPWIDAHPDWYTRDGSGTIVHPPGTNWLDVADLNFDKQEMRQAMIADMRYWTEEVGIDGFRCDAADMVPYTFWLQAIDSLRRGAPQTLLMFAEGIRSNHVNAGFDLIFSWNYYTQLKNSFQQGNGTANLWQAHLAEYNQMPTHAHRLRFITNHDEYAWDNTPAALFGGDAAAFAAFALSSCWSPVIMIYNGQEIGWPQLIPFFTKAPLNWNYKAAYRAQYENWMALRAARPLLFEGEMNLLQTASLTAFSRAHEQDTLLVVVNTRAQADSLQLPAHWQDNRWTSLFGSADEPHRSAGHAVNVWKRN
ncbi:MAG: alpha-amylase family glycosyl hydrolase [Bacteroidia bacterium]